MKRGWVVFLSVSGVVWLLIAGGIIWWQADQKRRDEQNQRLLMSVPWESTDGHQATLTFTKDKWTLRYFGGVGSRPTPPVVYPYTLRGDTLTLQGDKPFKVQIKLLTQSDLFLIEKGGVQSHYVNGNERRRN